MGTGEVHGGEAHQWCLKETSTYGSVPVSLIASSPPLELFQFTFVLGQAPDVDLGTLSVFTDGFTPWLPLGRAS